MRGRLPRRLDREIVNQRKKRQKSNDFRNIQVKNHKCSLLQLSFKPHYRRTLEVLVAAFVPQ